ncbi:MAG: hypothetical protein JNK80_12085, partial [Dechloromonas sp.]|nr:hypothetical protein [Dechloromonas sp.]
FDRLGELGIPPEAATTEDPNSDMTLIHELDDLIRNGFEGENDTVDVAEMTGTDFSNDNDELGERILTRYAFDGAQVEALLSEMGGTALLDAFLREFARTKGFQRLGRNVRKGLETELDMLSRKGRILIRGGMIRLL